MGIRGLTTFINNRSDLYLKDYKLHDCNVVLDGNSIASNLYKWHCKSNDCFGGDYDKFGRIIHTFFDTLSQCNITPYVIFDGGYERRKVTTVISRMKNKICAANNLNPVTEGSESVFPLFLREVFLDIVLELGVKTARCEFEGDMEVARIAKMLDCPVISYDSDFYIFGCLYIPFSTVELVARTGKCPLTKTSYVYLSCKIYKIEVFLKSYGGIDKSNLPLLAVVLGNDYVKGSLFRPFFRNLKIQKCNGNQSDQQKRIKSVMVWLQNETVESAIKTILGRFKCIRRKYILKRLEDAMRSYYEINSELLNFLGINPKIEQPVPVELELINSELQDDGAVSESDCSNGEENDSGDKEYTVDIEENEVETNEKEIKNNKCTELGELFLKNFRKCQYPSCFMDMIVQHRYYCIPQVEDVSKEHSHALCLNLLDFIYKVLNKNTSKPLTVISRDEKAGLKFEKLRISIDDVYTFDQIQTLDISDRSNIVLNLLGLDNKFVYTLNILPTEWHLFVMSVKYALQQRSFDKNLVISLFICYYILNYIDPHLGFYRTSKTFDKKFILFKTNTNKYDVVIEDNTCFENVTLKDCMYFMNKMISYFQMDIKLKTNYRLYDKTLVHSMAQLQSIFLHVKYVNSLLNYPYTNLKISKIFDGTFIYNMTNNLCKRTSISKYLEQLLSDCPKIVNNLHLILDVIDNSFTFTKEPVSQKSKRRKRKKPSKETNKQVIEDGNSEELEDSVIDPNNPYSILSVL